MLLFQQTKRSKVWGGDSIKIKIIPLDGPKHNRHDLKTTYSSYRGKTNRSIWCNSNRTSCLHSQSFNDNYKHELVRKQQEIIKCNELLGDWIKKFMELQSSLAVKDQPLPHCYYKQLNNLIMNLYNYHHDLFSYHHNLDDDTKMIMMIQRWCS